MSRRPESAALPHEAAMLDADLIADIGAAIVAAEAVLVVTHRDPDGDALGSLTAVGLALRGLGKRYTLAVEGGMPRRFAWLDLAPEVCAQLPADATFDLAIAVDCGDLDRLGSIYTALPTPKPPLINIDHHITNTQFGRWNLVAPRSSAAAELLYDLFCQLDYPITDRIANCLLAGIASDTLSFRTSNTTAATLSAAAALMRAGGDLHGVTQLALTRQPLAVLRLWQAGLNNLRHEGDLLWAVLDKQAVTAEANGFGASGLVGLLANVEEARVAMVLSAEADGRVKVSLRSRPPYNVAVVATALGGGGHPQAAGCTVDGPLAAAEARLVAACQAALTAQRPVR